MKFSAITLGLSLLTGRTAAFAPSKIVGPAAMQQVNTVPGYASAGTSLNLFKSKAKKMNAVAKVGKSDITEAEVRSLFSLWNSALATGDSRIVASRYTGAQFCSLLFQISRAQTSTR